MFSNLRGYASVFVCSLVILFGVHSSLVAQGSRSVLGLMPAEGSLSVGSEVQGALSSADMRSARDAYMEAWDLEGQAGESVTLDLISDDFDAHLYVDGPGLESTLSDTDAGGACHSRLTFTFLETGTFRVIASSEYSRQTGTYILRASSEPGPTAGYACGGMNPAFLDDLPTDGRVLSIGETVSSSLTGASQTIPEGKKAEAWLLEGRAGETVTVTYRSDAFDCYLYITGPGIQEVMTDDDGAGDLDSRLDITFPVDGTYRVIASVLSSGEGPYSIRVEETLGMHELPPDAGFISVGEIHTGWLTDADPEIEAGRNGQVWALEGMAGDTYTIDLMSEDFDAYLYFVGPGIIDPRSNDDGGEGRNSRITVTLPEDGTYRVIASALYLSDSGSYQLQVTARER
ncbi:MAG: PPC domain-containing protein [Myxococcota bacterium]|nr:PPC domain-containing protein [Myxococcota bacterium]